MTDVEFNEPNYATRASGIPAAGGSSAFSRLVIKTGLAKDEKGAQRVLLIIAILAIVIAAFVFFGGHKSAPEVPPPAVGAVPGAMP